MRLRWLESAGLIHVKPFSVLFKADHTSVIAKFEFMANKFSVTGSNVPEVLSSFLLIVFRSPSKIELLSKVACCVTQLDRLFINSRLWEISFDA